ncbi:MAG: tRNA (adenosine(37)-N6)-threonylcarbamoyltransferase complex dimerization subunit type 1 TsaB [Alphaproteobacteria bacterium]|nr:tRNA (adenosine(37)-N6)-threonylcarbamoyltransferase complex dimerization subunit type 1 TsaB [Alphaproteobacteria bacterium]
MLVLGINTVGADCDAAVFTDEGVAFVCSEPMAQGHDARLAIVVQNVMREAGRTFQEIDRIAVVAGPGSFTGVRVGVAFARGLALALDRPAVGVTSLEAVAARSGRGRILAALPARRRLPDLSWWAQIIENGQGQGEPVEADARKLVEMATGVEVVLGDGLPNWDFQRPQRAGRPSAINAALWVSRLEGELPPARPIYVREPDATPMAPA